MLPLYPLFQIMSSLFALPEASGPEDLFDAHQLLAATHFHLRTELHLGTQHSAQVQFLSHVYVLQELERVLVLQGGTQKLRGVHWLFREVVFHQRLKFLELFFVLVGPRGLGRRFLGLFLVVTPALVLGEHHHLCLGVGLVGEEVLEERAQLGGVLS